MEKKQSSEKVTLIIISTIIIIFILATIYTIFVSNNSLISNNYEEEKNKENTQNTTTTNNNNNNNTTPPEDKPNTPNTQTPPANPPTPQPTPVMTEIATYTTTLYDKEQNRIDNINLAISKLNGKIIKNNEEFSFNNTIGRMDESQGFKKATGFDTNGKKIKIAGGGLCQISSTIYNCALISNLQVTERHPHSRRVYYVPKDKDATIVYGSLDLKFLNNTGSDIKIEASNTNTDVTIKFIKIQS